MTSSSLLRLAALIVALAAPLAACVPSASSSASAPYDRADQYKTNLGIEMGAPSTHNSQ
jgi:ABC-type oligopeptide transport system substrate-binding subunit